MALGAVGDKMEKYKALIVIFNLIIGGLIHLCQHLLDDRYSMAFIDILGTVIMCYWICEVMI